MNHRGASKGFAKDYRPDEIFDFLCSSITKRVGEGEQEKRYVCQTIAEYERLVREGYGQLEWKRIETIDEWERQVAEANRQREAWEAKGEDEGMS